MIELSDNRLIQAFADMRQAGRKALLPFLTAGLPDLQTTEAILHELAGRGVRVCELGFPFSDPIADGPVIQSSYTQALAAGITTEKIFQMVRRFRHAEAIENPQLTLAAMVSYTIVYRHGVKAFLADAAAAGFDATIIPDLPLEEAASFESQAAEAGLANVMLISPTTAPARRGKIARHSRGFIYFISVAGITGERARLPQSTIDAVAGLRRHTDTPVCVGFGISRPETVAQVCRVADGAIVGSAIVRRITDLAARAPRKTLIRKVGDFVGELLAPIR